jgi:hypothetical protein
MVTDRAVDGPTATRAMADFLETRWRGVRHVFWGSQLRQAQVTTGLHLEQFNVDRQLMEPLPPPVMGRVGVGGMTAEAVEAVGQP